VKQRFTTIGGAALLVVFALSSYHFVFSTWSSGRYGFVDFPIFLQNTQQFLAGGELYPFAEQPESYYPGAPVYKFPPLFALFLVPVVAGGIAEHVYTLHWGLQVALYATAVALVLYLLKRPGRPLVLMVGAVAALNFEPFFETLWRLQIETPILLLLALVWWGLARGRPELAGTAWGFAAMIKIYPVFLMLYFGARRRLRVLVFGALAAIVILVSTIFVFGVEQNRVFYLEILPNLLRETPVELAENTSWGRWMMVLFGASSAAAKRAIQIAGLGMIAASVWVVLSNRTTPPSGRRAGVELSMFVALMLLCMPNAWANYQLLLLLPVLALIEVAVGGERIRYGVLAPTAAAYALMLFYAPCQDPSVAWPCAQTPFFLGLVQLPRGFHDLMVDLRGLAQLLLWATTFWVLHTDARRS